MYDLGMTFLIGGPFAYYMRTQIVKTSEKRGNWLQGEPNPLGSLTKDG